MPWQKSSADLVNLFEQLVPAAPNIEHKKMFGCNCAFVNGNLFSGLFEQSMTFRLSPADLAAFLDQPDTAHFEPMPGHKMKGYGILHHPFATGEDVLAGWIRCSLEFASKLPAKGMKAKAKKAPAGRSASRKQS